jgi:hypothetical protein
LGRNGREDCRRKKTESLQEIQICPACARSCTDQWLSLPVAIAGIPLEPALLRGKSGGHKHV